MSRSKHSETQIITTSKQVEAGHTTEDVAHEYGASKHAIFARKARLEGMEVTGAQNRRLLGDKNSRLRHLASGLSLDREMLKAVTAKTA
jgi:putative transposase